MTCFYIVAKDEETGSFVQFTRVMYMQSVKYLSDTRVVISDTHVVISDTHVVISDTHVVSDTRVMDIENLKIIDVFIIPSVGIKKKVI